MDCFGDGIPSLKTFLLDAVSTSAFLVTCGVLSHTIFKNEQTYFVTKYNGRKIKPKGSIFRCQVNGKMFWLCEDHKIETRSKKEARYQGKGITRKESMPISDIPETYANVEQETRVNQSKDSSEKKIFRKHLSKQQPPSLKRQTSQMCSVM